MLSVQQTLANKLSSEKNISQEKLDKQIKINNDLKENLEKYKKAYDDNKWL